MKSKGIVCRNPLDNKKDKRGIKFHICSMNDSNWKDIIISKKTKKNIISWRFFSQNIAVFFVKNICFVQHCLQHCNFLGDRSLPEAATRRLSNLSFFRNRRRNACFCGVFDTWCENPLFYLVFSPVSNFRICALKKWNILLPPENF